MVPPSSRAFVFVLLAFLQLTFLLRGTRAQAAQSTQKSSVFRVKYVAEGAVYIDAGRNAEIREGMKLSVIPVPPDGAISDGIRFRGDAHVAELRVTSVADSSSVCEIISESGDLVPGQAAFLTPDSVETRLQAENAVEAEKYPVVLTFTNGDPLDEEIRATEENKVINDSPMSHIRGRIGFDYGGTNESGGFNSKQVGMVIASDMTNLGGTYWNFTGYWRGYLTTSGSNVPGTTTLNDLINRTYHLGFTYDSPYSANILGVGRLFLPWAPSLSTIDGAYWGHKIGRKMTAGAFGGSTPDPTSWSYAPNQHIVGSFVNYETGSFDRLRFFSTAGIALTTMQWRVARQFAFFENNFSIRRNVYFYNSMQVDAARTSPFLNGGSNPTGISQSYSSLRVQPVNRLTLGLNHNYFRNLPTFDPRLVITGLLDQYLFQGLSGDVRVELPCRMAVYSSLGRSKNSTDAKSSWNQGYGLSFGRLWKTGIFADMHYSKFDSAFGSGQYEAFSLSRSLTDSLRLQVYGGHQLFNTSLSSNTAANFVNAVADWNLGTRYFMEANFGSYSGTSLSYRQWSTTIGSRFGGSRHQ
jgi:hypothetical protein